MSTNLIKATDEISGRARADRSIQSGRVVLVNRTTNTSILDVGFVDFNGAAVYMHEVPFSPQSPPNTNDTVAILRTNSSAYSHVVGGGSQVGGANSGQVVTSAGVNSVKKTGETTGQQGNVILDPGTGVTITRVGKTFTFAAPPVSGSPVIAANAQSGTSYTLVLGDAGKIVECTNASAFTLTVPPNSSVAFAVGTTIEVWQGGAIFPVTVAAGAGVTLLSRAGTLTTNGQYSQLRLRKQATDTWQVSGV